MVFFLLLDCQSAVAYIFEEMNLGPYWRKGILWVKSLALITTRNIYEFQRPVCHHRVVTTQHANLNP